MLLAWVILLSWLASWFLLSRWLGKITKSWAVGAFLGLLLSSLLFIIAIVVTDEFRGNTTQRPKNVRIGQPSQKTDDFWGRGERELKRQQEKQGSRNSIGEPGANAIEISLNVSYTETSSGLRIHGNTNLPDGTKIGVSIKQGGQDFDIFVKNGQFSSANFTNRGQPLAGDYQVTVFIYKNKQWQNSAILKQLESYQGEMINGRKIEKVINISVGNDQARKSNLEQQSLNEQRFNQLAQMAVDLLGKGKQMDQLRNRSLMRECGTRMRELQPRAKSLQAQVDQLPRSYKKILLGAASSVLTLCVSCSDSLAMENCKEAENYLREAGIL